MGTDAAAESPAEPNISATATEPGEAAESAPAPPAVDDTPTVEDYVNDESLDLEESGLPTETVKEIRKLRKDASKWRDTARTWSEATQTWSDDDMNELRTALSLAHHNPQAVGQWFLEQGKMLMGDAAPEDPAPAEPDTPATDDGPLTKDDVSKLVAEALAEHSKKSEEEKRLEQQVQRVKAETEELGFGPSHPLHFALLSTAKANDISLPEAAELLKQGGGVADQTNTQDAPAEAGRTPVPPEGVTPAGTREVRDPRKAATERLNQVLPEGKRGFADL